jgi:hypothetical protein
METPQDRLKRLIRKAVDECCLRDAVNSSWLANPMEAEQHLIDELLPFANEFPQTDRQESVSESMKKLQELGRRFQHLVAYAEKANTEVTVTDVQLDVARMKAQIEILDWVAATASEGDHETDLDVAISQKVAEIQKQLAPLMGVVQCT